MAEESVDKAEEVAKEENPTEPEEDDSEDECYDESDDESEGALIFASEGDVPKIVSPNVLLGTEQAAKDLELLKEEKITHILTLSPYFKPPFPEDFTYKVVSVVDDEKEDFLSQLPESIEFLKQASTDGVVMFHCANDPSMSRSGTLAIAWLMSNEGLDQGHAFAQIKAVNGKCTPNKGFIEQLKLFEAMGNKVDKSSEAYKQYIVNKEQDTTKSAAFEFVEALRGHVSPRGTNKSAATLAAELQALKQKENGEVDNQEEEAPKENEEEEKEEKANSPEEKATEEKEQEPVPTLTLEPSDSKSKKKKKKTKLVSPRALFSKKKDKKKA